jgi:hypothetical protein
MILPPLTRSRRWPRAALVVCFLLTPAVVVSLLLAVRLRTTLAACGPLGDDDTHYWNEIVSFSSVGFDGGYFVANEEPAPARWTHFGPHGPAFPVLYGTLARCLGWGEASGPIFNLLVLAVGSAIWLALVRPDARRLGTVLFLTATFWPCLLYIPATMQEAFHCAIAFILAGLAHRMLAGEVRPGTFGLFVAGVAVASMFRVSWTLALLPGAAIVWPRVEWRARLGLLSTVVVAIPLLLLASRQICAGYPNFLSAALALGRRDPAAGFRAILSHAQLSLDELLSFEDRPLELTLRWEILSVMAVAAVLTLIPNRIGSRLQRTMWTAISFFALAIAARDLIGGIALTVFAAGQSMVHGRRWSTALVSGGCVFALQYLRTDPFAPGFFKENYLDALKASLVIAFVWLHRDLVADVVKRAVAAHPPDEACPYVFAGLNLSTVLALVLIAYDVKYSRSYRVLAPHLLLSALVLASGPAYRWTITLAAANLLFFSAFVTEFAAFHNSRVNGARLAAGVIDLRPHLTFEAPFSLPWRNTLLVPDVHLVNRVRVPPGIGVSWGVEFSGGALAPVPYDSPYRAAILSYADDWLSRPTKSRYLLMTSGQARRWQGCRLRLLEQMPVANLYLNLDFGDPVQE